MERLPFTQIDLPPEVFTAVTDLLAETLLVDYYAGTARASTTLSEERDEDDCCDLRSQIDRADRRK